jgi:hypothetical protein
LRDSLITEKPPSEVTEKPLHSLTEATVPTHMNTAPSTADYDIDYYIYGIAVLSSFLFIVFLVLLCRKIIKRRRSDIYELGMRNLEMGEHSLPTLQI